jgi:hypothetical protein
MTVDRLEWLLGNWADYMKQPSHKLGYPSKSLCMSSGGASGEDEFDIMCDEVDTKCAQAIDSIIDSLSMPQRTAVNHVWLNVTHHYPTHELDLLEAQESMIRLCVKRGVI